MRTDAERAAELADFAENQFAAKVTAMAARLRQMADDIERRAVIGEGGRFALDPPGTEAAMAVIHTLTWGFANLGIDLLVSQGSRVDVNRARAVANLANTF